MILTYYNSKNKPPNLHQPSIPTTHNPESPINLSLVPRAPNPYTHPSMINQRHVRTSYAINTPQKATISPSHSFKKGNPSFIQNFLQYLNIPISNSYCESTFPSWNQEKLIFSNSYHNPPSTKKFQSTPCQSKNSSNKDTFRDVLQGLIAMDLKLQCINKVMSSHCITKSML